MYPGHWTHRMKSMKYFGYYGFPPQSRMELFLITDPESVLPLLPLVCRGDAGGWAVHRNGLMWAVRPRSVHVSFVLYQAAVVVLKDWSEPCGVLINILLLWCWDSDVRKLCSVLFSLCLPDLFLQKLSAVLSHSCCFFLLVFLQPFLPFLPHLYVFASHNVFYFKCLLYSWFSLFLSSWVDGNVQEKFMLPNL